MALPGSYRPYQFFGPFQAGIRVMGQIMRPGMQPNSRQPVPMALPDGRSAAVRAPGQVWDINKPIPRNLFPGRTARNGR